VLTHWVSINRWATLTKSFGLAAYGGFWQKKPTPIRKQEEAILRRFPPPANKKAEPPFQEFRLMGCRHLNYLYCLAL